MYTKIGLDNLAPRDIEGVEPALLPVGLELRPAQMRPSAWEFAPGESTNRHRQREQEELYLVLTGRFEMEVEGERFDLEPGDVVIVPPESWRQLTAREPGRLFVVGAPNVKDDDIQESDGGAAEGEESEGPGQ